MKKIYHLVGGTFIAVALTVVPAAAQSTSGTQGTSGTTGGQTQGGTSSGGTQGTQSGSGQTSGSQPASGTQSGQTTGSGSGRPGQQDRDRDRKVTSSGEKVGEDVPTQGTQTDQRGRTAADQPAKPGDGAGALAAPDRTFLSDAMEGNRAEVELAELAEQKAASQPVRELAQTLRQHHSQANTKLTSIASQADAADNQPELKPQHKQLQDRLSRLEGEAFDSAYASEMVKEHEKDIQKYEKASKQLQNTELKGYAAATLPILKKHLEMARAAHSSTQKTR